MASIARAVARFKDHPQDHLDPRLVHEACVAAGYVWRERVLGPVVMVRLMLLQVLHGNVSCQAVGRLAGLTFSVTAYCKARTRLPVDVLGCIAALLEGKRGLLFFDYFSLAPPGRAVFSVGFSRVALCCSRGCIPGLLWCCGCGSKSARA